MQKIIEKHKKQLEQTFRKEGVVLAYLFGSQARGATHHFSDIDIGVLLDKEVPEEQYFDKALKLAGELEGELQTKRVDVALLNRAKPFLRYQIVFGGKLLFAKNRAAQIFFENRTMKEYDDTKHILQFSLNAMRERIKKGLFGINPYSAYGFRS